MTPLGASNPRIARSSLCIAFPGWKLQESLLAGPLPPTGAGTGGLLSCALLSGQRWMLESTNAWHRVAVHAIRHQHMARCNGAC